MKTGAYYPHTAHFLNDICQHIQFQRDYLLSDIIFSRKLSKTDDRQTDRQTMLTLGKFELFPGISVVRCSTISHSFFLFQTRMQSLRPTANAMYNGGIFSAIRSMARSEGLLVPFRGMAVVATGAGPAHALYFSSYEFSKKVLNSKEIAHSHVAHGQILGKI